MNIGAFDVVSIVILLVLAVRGAFRGFIDEFLSMAAVIGGLLAASVFTSRGAVLVSKYINSTFWSPVISFLILFLLAYIIVKIFETMLNSFVEKIQLEKLDQALGFFLGLLEGALLIVLLVFVLEIQSFIDTSHLFDKSLAYQIANKVIPVGKELFEANIKMQG